MRKLWLLLPLLAAGCAGSGAPGVEWEQPGADLETVWRDRASGILEAALLARTEFRESGRVRSFTLELFYRAPDTYMLRGRGTLGITGFRAKVAGDSLVILMDRGKRGFEGAIDAYPDDSTRALWQLLRSALPWLVGVTALSGATDPRVSVVTAADAARPQEARITHETYVLELSFGRFRGEFPFWHLQSASGRSRGTEMRMEIRQQLYNSGLPAEMFELALPPGTLPLTD